MVGSIRKIVLKGFVTYDYCQFYPGPNLNMIIGPNGTGKSTIVCGIALGLGGSTSVLGRAKDVYDFVKHGYKEATIEITLQDKNDYKITITRTIDKVKKCSIWTINNKISTQKQVLSTVKGLNIQVDNLCQFLPQDKVCEFAQMSPIELLKSTLKASGSTELSEDHSKLVLLRNDQKELIKLVEEDSTQVKSLESINQSKKQEVERFKEREEYLRTIELYKKRIILSKYSKAKILYDQSKIDRRKLQDKVASMNEKLEPLNKQKEYIGIFNTISLLIQYFIENRKGQLKSAL
jgi:chromosome segregation ATPase